MEPCLRFGLIVSFLQLQDAATRTPSLPAGWWILNGNREKNKKSYANIILLLCFFFSGKSNCFQHTVATMIKLWTARSPHSFGTEGSSSRRKRWQVLHISNLTNVRGQKKWHRKYRPACPTWGPTPRGVQRDPTLGPKPNTGNSKMDRNGAEMTWNCFLCFWFPGSLMLLKKPFQDKSTYKVR